MTEIFLYYQLQTKSRRAILRVRGRFGHPYEYTPRGDLLKRLARDNNMTVEAVYRQLLAERRELIRSIGFSDLL